MARTVSEALICDLCGTQTKVSAWTITGPKGVSVIDLCAGDAKPLAKMWDAGSTEPRKRLTGDRRRGAGHAVVPVD